MKDRFHRRGEPWLALLLATSGVLPQGAHAGSLDYQLHGFAAQGFAWSEGNNVLGHSTTGSVAFNEFGLNGAVTLAPGLLLSAQGLVRDAGKTEDDSLRLDYAQIDYGFLRNAGFNAGIRAGRVKNPFGLYNDTRDVVFTRPGILLPQSIYLEGEGLRSLLFSSDGAQLYGGTSLGDHYTSLTVTHGLDRRFSDLQKRVLFGGSLPADIDLTDFYVARLQDESDGGVWRTAFSFIHGDLEVVPNPGVPLSGHLAANLFVLSGRYNGERVSITSEYSLIASRGEFSLSGPIDGKSDGGYVQGDYRLNPQWSLMARYDLSFSNRNDRDGRKFAAATGGDRYGQFTRDATVGIKWLPDQHWGVWSEYHLVDGTSTLSQLDNAGRTPDDHWSMFLLMGAYRF